MIMFKASIFLQFFVVNSTTKVGIGVTLLVEIYFVRSGWLNLNNGALGYFGNGGDYWSEVAMGYGTGTWSAIAYYFRFGPSIVYPSSYYSRFFGFPVRCLV